MPVAQPLETPEAKTRGGAKLPPIKEAKLSGKETGHSAVKGHPAAEVTTEPENPAGRKPGVEGPLAGRHILVVEDTVLLRKLATSILTKVGANVYSVANGRLVRTAHHLISLLYSVMMISSKLTEGQMSRNQNSSTKVVSNDRIGT